MLDLLGFCVCCLGDTGDVGGGVLTDTAGDGGDTAVVMVGGVIAVGEGEDEQVEEEGDLASADRFERLLFALRAAALSIFFKGV